MDTVEELKAEVARLRAALEEIANPHPEYFKGKGCSDGNCVVYSGAGWQHTNGGCHCPESRAMWVRMRLQKLMQDAKEALEGKKPA